MIGHCKQPCSLVQGAANINIGGDGPSPCSVMFVGEAPGQFEDSIGQPFVGPAGWILDEQILRPLGWERNQVRVSNVVRCRPPNNRDPQEEEILACRQHLLQEIQEVKPSVIICLGAVAFKALVGDYDFKLSRGYIFNSIWVQQELGLNPFILPTNHPAAIMRDWTLLGGTFADTRKALSTLQNGCQQRPTQVTICQSKDQVWDQVAELSKGPILAFDLETTGFDPDTDQVLCYSFATEPGKATVIPLLTQYAQPYWDDETLTWVLTQIRNLLQNSELQKAAHNAAFDIEFSRSLGIDVQNLQFDTMLMHHLCDENEGHSLTNVAARLTNMPPYELSLKQAEAEAHEAYKAAAKNARAKKPKMLSAEKAAEQKAILECGDNYGLINPQILWHYAGCDADACLQLVEPLQVHLAVDGLTDLYRRIPLAMLPIVGELREEGIPVDRERLEKAHQEVNDKELALREQIYQQLAEAVAAKEGKPVEEVAESCRINFRSAPQMRKMFIERLDWPIVRRTKTDSPSLGREAMADYAEMCYSVASTIVEDKKLLKLMSDFLAGSDGKSGMTQFIKEDGRVHCKFNITGTRTGRFSCSEPPMHNIPKKPASIRSLYVPEPGHWWMEADYSQFEIHILAEVSKDPLLREWCRNRLDVHRMVAATINEIDPEEVTDTQRSAAKAVSFGTVYGIGAPRLAKDLGMTPEEAQKLLDSFLDHMTGVKEYYNRVHHDLQTLGYVRNAFGRRRRLYGVRLFSDENLQQMRLGDDRRKELQAIRHDLERQGVNSPIQGGGSDVLNLACVKLAAWLDEWDAKSRIIHHHHDAIHLSVAPDELVYVARGVKRIMEEPVSEFDGYRFPTDLTIGPAWYDVDEKQTTWLRGQLICSSA